MATAGRSRWSSTIATSVSTSAASKPMRRAMRSARTTPFSVWSPGRPLPRSWRSVPTSSRSGRATSRMSSQAWVDRLQEMAVDGEAVEGVALRPAPHQLPLGQDPAQQPVAVERLELLERRSPTAEQRDEGVPHRVGPPLGERREGIPTVAQRRLRDRQPLVRRRRRTAQHQLGVDGRVGFELDLGIAHHHPGGDGALPVPPAGRSGRPHRAPRVVGLPAHDAAGFADPLHQLVGVDAERLGDRVLLVQEQHVRGAARRAGARPAPRAACRRRSAGPVTARGSVRAGS